MKKVMARVFEPSEIEQLADEIKALVVGALVSDGLIDIDTADLWCRHTTLIVRNETMFESFKTAIFGNRKSNDPIMSVVSKRVVKE